MEGEMEAAMMAYDEMSMPMEGEMMADEMSMPEMMANEMMAE